MSEHTPGKLRVDVHKNILCDGGQMVAFPCISGGLNQEANARRLVAAWNACDGLSAEQLERAGTLDRASVSRNAAISNAIKNLTAERDSLRAVNAELLEALEACHYTLTNPQIGQWSYMEGSEIYADFSEAADKARAAITKANTLKGESHEQG